MISDIKTGWEVDRAIEPMNTKLARLHAEEQAEHYAIRSKVFVLFGTDDIESPGFLHYGLTKDNAALEAALGSITYNVELLYINDYICIAKLVFDKEKSVYQVRVLVDEACAAVQGINIQYIEAINSLQAPVL